MHKPPTVYGPVTYAAMLAILAFAAPPVSRAGIEPIVKDGTVTVSGQVSSELGRYAQLGGNIEYLACSPGGKTYESLLVLDVQPSALRQALTDAGVEPGSASSSDASGNVVPPSGPGVTLTVSWNDAKGELVCVRAEELILDVKTNAPMHPTDWVFTGSRTLTDPATGQATVQADLTGNIISTHQADRSVLLQNPLAEATDEARYRPNDGVLPPHGTPVRLTIDFGAPIGQRIHIVGHVQGVGYRDFARTAAESLGVVGYVRNLEDGSVELIAEGRHTVLSELTRRLQQGPPTGTVSGLSVEKIPVTGNYTDFNIAL